MWRHVRVQAAGQPAVTPGPAATARASAKVIGPLAFPAPAGSFVAWLQEYFLEDLVEIAVYIGQHVPHLAAGQQMEDLIIALIVFQGSPAYVKNPFLRSRMAEVSTWLASRSCGRLRLCDCKRRQGPGSRGSGSCNVHSLTCVLNAFCSVCLAEGRLAIVCPSVCLHTQPQSCETPPHAGFVLLRGRTDLSTCAAKSALFVVTAATAMV